MPTPVPTGAGAPATEELDGPARARAAKRQRSLSKKKAGSLGADAKWYWEGLGDFNEAYFPENQGRKLQDHEIITALRMWSTLWSAPGKDGKLQCIGLASAFGSPPTPITKTEAIKITAGLAGIGRAALKRALNTWQAKRELDTGDDLIRGAASPLHPANDARERADSAIPTIKAFVQQQLDESPTSVTRRAIREHVEQECGFLISDRQLKRVLKLARISYGEVHHQPRAFLRDQHTWQEIFFLPQMAEAVQAEAAGKAIVINFDQSYAHTTLSPRYGFRFDASPVGRQTSKSKGRLVCISDAISSWGGVAAYHNGKIHLPRLPGAVRAPHEPEVVISANQMFTTNKNTKVADYHGHFNTTVFQKWFVECLIPALKAQVPGAFLDVPTVTIYIQLDSAPYHTARDKTKEHVKGMNRWVILKNLKKYKIKTITIFREGDNGKLNQVALQANKKDITGDGAPGIAELRAAAAYEFAEKAPHLLYNSLEHICAPYGIKLLWNPPSKPIYSPVETFWAQGKLYGRWKNTAGRTPAELVTHLLEGFYTSALANPKAAKVHGGNFVVPEPPAPDQNITEVSKCPSAAALFRKARDFMDAAIAGLPVADDGVPWLEGTLMGLTLHDELKEPVRRATSRDAQIYRAVTLSSNGVGAMPASAIEEAWDDDDDDEVDEEVVDDMEEEDDE